MIDRKKDTSLVQNKLLLATQQLNNKIALPIALGKYY
jgi:hypothetical protein